MTIVIGVVAGLAFVGVIGGLVLWAVSRLAEAGELPPFFDGDGYPVEPSEREARDLAEYRRSRVIPIGRAS